MNACCKVLLVEDNDADARLIEVFLRASGGAELLREARLEDALHYLVEHPVDVVLLDLGLPDSEGLEGLRAILEVSPQAPVLILTGHDDEAIGEAAIQAGAQDFLTKGSFDAPSLRRSLRYAVERSLLGFQLLQQNEHLVRAQKLEAIGRLAGGVAHDFNNLLMVILGYADDALGRLDDDDLAADLQHIVEAAQQGAELTKQLLAYSRRQGRVARSLDLNERLRAQAPLVNRLVLDDVQVDLDLTEGLGTVRADPHQLDQVVMNLAANARDAMPDGGRLRIQTSRRILDAPFERREYTVPPGRYVELAVRDQGGGMSPEVQAHAFEPFYTTKDSDRGTGLGLATVYGIVKQSEGYIWIDSTPGEGTAFHILLPEQRSLPEACTSPGSSRTVLAPPPPSESGRETILVVDDNDALRDITKRVLERRGFTVLTAGAGKEALEALEDLDKPLDLLVSDLLLPDVNGREVAAQVRARFPKVKQLFISGYPGDPSVLEEIAAQGAAFRAKPFRPREFVAEVERLLSVA